MIEINARMKVLRDELWYALVDREHQRRHIPMLSDAHQGLEPLYIIRDETHKVEDRIMRVFKLISTIRMIRRMNSLDG